MLSSSCGWGAKSWLGARRRDGEEHYDLLVLDTMMQALWWCEQMIEKVYLSSLSQRFRYCLAWKLLEDKFLLFLLFGGTSKFHDRGYFMNLSRFISSCTDVYLLSTCTRIFRINIWTKFEFASCLSVTIQCELSCWSYKSSRIVICCPSVYELLSREKRMSTTLTKGKRQSDTRIAGLLLTFLTLLGFWIINWDC